MSTYILILTVLTATIIILGNQLLSHGNALNVLNKSNTNITDGNGGGQNATAPGIQTDSLSEDNKTGNIASLPGKCLGSALCPD